MAGLSIILHALQMSYNPLFGGQILLQCSRAGQITDELLLYLQRNNGNEAMEGILTLLLFRSQEKTDEPLSDVDKIFINRDLRTVINFMLVHNMVDAVNKAVVLMVLDRIGEA